MKSIRNIKPNRCPGPRLFRLFKLFTAAALCLAAGAGAAAEALGDMPTFSASYSVRYGILRGTMTLSLERQDDAYHYETSLSPSGVASWLRRGEIRETTTILAADDKVLPLDYASTDTIARPERRTNYVFDAAAGKVSGEYKTREVSAPMRTGGQNRISAQVAIMRALQAGDEITRLPVFDRGRWKEFEFTVLPDQSADTPSGRFDTVEVRYSSPGDKRAWSLHCAPALDYLPVMIVFREGNKVKSRARLTDYERQGPAR